MSKSGTAPRTPRRRRVPTRRPHLPSAPKARGELAEARFLAKAMSFGLIVNKPFGDSARYDFVIDADGRLSRVQVKSAWTPRSHWGRYEVSASSSGRRQRDRHPYRREEIDFLAAFIAPEDTWFILPVTAVSSRKKLMLTTRSTNPFARYREAWGLLGNEDR